MPCGPKGVQDGLTRQRQLVFEAQAPERDETVLSELAEEDAGFMEILPE